jgi:hypothetical protein
MYLVRVREIPCDLTGVFHKIKWRRYGDTISSVKTCEGKMRREEIILKYNKSVFDFYTMMFVVE